MLKLAQKLFLCLAICPLLFSGDRQKHEYDYLDGVKTVPLTSLPEYADGVQLEGGYVYKNLKPGQKYANVSVVWDMPFKNLEASSAFAHGNEKFRESRLEGYNEHRVIYLISSLILYYLKESTPQQKTVFLFYIGKKSSTNLFEIVEKVLKKFDPGLMIKKNDSSGTRIGWISDQDGRSMEILTHYAWLNSKVFDGADTIVGFSWNGGFCKKCTSGDFLIPTQFIDISKGKKFNLLFLRDRYAIVNDLHVNLSKFIDSQKPRLIELVNQEFTSENTQKSEHRATMLQKSDFYDNATLLGTWDILEPSSWPEDVVIPQ